MKTRRAGRLARAVLCVLPLAAVLLLYHSALNLELMGDDYQWWQHARAAMHCPVLLFEDLDTFYRPASTWTLVADRELTGDSPVGFHLTNLLLHGLAGVLLVLVGRRLRLPVPVAVVVGVLWAVSPFAEEPAISVAIRFQDLLLLSWLGLILAWPADGKWSSGRRLGVTLVTLFAAMSKETWVMTPALVVALEVSFGRRNLRGWIRTAAPFGLAVVMYTGLYFLAFPGGKGYYSADPHVLAKLPHQLAAFLHLEQLTPLAFPFDWKGMAALLVVSALAALGWRRRAPAAIIGLALLILPMAPTLMVPFLPTRYTAIPYAGFLLLVASWVAWIIRELGGHVGRKRAVAALALVVSAVVLVAGGVTVRADLQDSARASVAHRRLLDEAEAVARQLPTDRPILVVRGETENPLATVSRSPRGLPKLFYVRHQDPYGLIDAAALFEWVLRSDQRGYVRITPEEVAGVSGDVLVHRVGGFVWAGRHNPDLGREASRWKQSGLRARIIRATALGCDR